MEVAGLGIGIAGLAGLFSACLEIIESIDSYNDFESESASIFALFEADSVRFRQWGQIVGIDKSEQEDDHHEALDDPEVRSAVDKILQCLKDIDKNIDCGTPSNSGIASPRRQGGSDSKKRVQFGKFQGTNSRMRKLSWTLRHKKKILSQFELFDRLVQKLYELVPPSRMAAAGGTVTDDMNRSYVTIQRISKKLEKQVSGE